MPVAQCRLGVDRARLGIVGARLRLRRGVRWRIFASLTPDVRSFWSSPLSRALLFVPWPGVSRSKFPSHKKRQISGWRHFWGQVSISVRCPGGAVGESILLIRTSVDIAAISALVSASEAFIWYVGRVVRLASRACAMARSAVGGVGQTSGAASLQIVRGLEGVAALAGTAVRRPGPPQTD